MKDTVLLMNNICKSFGSTCVLRNVSFKVNRGDVLVILGRSGAGKTTLLRTINYLIEPNSGEIYFNDTKVINNRQIIRSVRSKIGFVFQNFNLISHLSAIDNVALPLVKVKNMNWRQARKQAEKALIDVELADKTLNYPSQLSGGQQQRVGIARALVMEPDLLLFDEPTSALDPSLVGEVMNVMRKLSLLGKTMIVVTHEIRFAENTANRIIFMENGEIIEDTDPVSFFNSNSVEIKGFLNSVSEAV
ncbi:MAG: amino acid ABC transporter ATP-binding protein [Thermotogota bacterium]|nr:amino acid ABC transporter ATP-binding protein [Thermotogota bacterium]